MRYSVALPLLLSVCVGGVGAVGVLAGCKPPREGDDPFLVPMEQVDMAQPPPVCAKGSTRCTQDKTAAEVCDGAGWKLAMTCNRQPGDVCDAGLCTLPCDNLPPGNVGCVFYPANLWSTSQDGEFGIVATNTSDKLSADLSLSDAGGEIARQTAQRAARRQGPAAGLPPGRGGGGGGPKPPPSGGPYPGAGGGGPNPGAGGGAPYPPPNGGGGGGGGPPAASGVAQTGQNLSAGVTGAPHRVQSIEFLSRTCGPRRRAGEHTLYGRGRIKKMAPKVRMFDVVSESTSARGAHAPHHGVGPPGSGWGLDEVGVGLR